MKSSTSNLFQNLLLVVVSCFVLIGAKFPNKTKYNTQFYKSSTSSSNSIWNNIFHCFDQTDLEDEPIDEDNCDEQEQSVYTCEIASLIIVSPQSNFNLKSYLVNDLTYINQAEPESQPRPPQA